MIALAGCGHDPARRSAQPGSPACVRTHIVSAGDCSGASLYDTVRQQLLEHQDRQHYTALAVALLAPHIPASDISSAFNLAFTDPDYSCLRSALLAFVRNSAGTKQDAALAIAVYRKALEQFAGPLPPGGKQIASWLIGRLAPMEPFRAAERVTIQGEAYNAMLNVAACS